MSPWFFQQKRIQSPEEQPTQRSPTQSLLHYETGTLPPSARVDPKLKHKPRRPLRAWDYLKFCSALATKATEVTADVLRHHIWGPRRSTWGIEMTIVTSLIRGAERHSSLVDIGTIRMLAGIGGLVPLPSDALVSPVTFRVRRRNLRGLLADFDAQESGDRELSGEWVVGRKTWQRMQTDWKAAKRPVSSLGRSYSDLDANYVPSDDSSKRKERVILYIHGGAYYLSSAAAQRIISIPLAKFTDSRVFALDYRLAPETCFPGPLHDAVSAYFRLVEDLHIPPENIILAGDSAGGGLGLALLMYLRDNEYALPSSAILLSPWVDLTMSCESWDSNAPYDVVPFPTADNHMHPIALYLGENTEQYLTHPYASPLFGDFKGLPPLLVQAGDAEVLRDEITLLAHKATLAGVQVIHELYEDAIHVFQAYPFLDASQRAFQSMRAFVRETLPKYQSRSPQLLAAIAERGMEQEIESDRSVFVGGDGVEEKVQDLHGTKSAAEMGNVSDPESDLVDDGPSWVRSPVTSTVKRPAKLSRQNTSSQFEEVDLDYIPHLNLSPPLASPVPLHAASLPPESRPSLSPSSSSTSVLSVSLAESRPSPAPTSGSGSTSPRRIQSTGCLSLLGSVAPPDNPKSSVRGDSPQSERAYPKQNVTFVLAAESSSTHHARSRSTTFLSPPSNFGVTNINPPRHSPSLRKKVSGLMMKSKGVHPHTAMPLSLGDGSGMAGSADIKALVNDWTRLGPANHTVMVSASRS